MINVIGGFYKELCLYPEWDYNYGSGGRASAILSSLGAEVCFHSYVHKEKEKEFKYFSKTFRIKTNTFFSSEMINFEYYHSLSAPNIHTLNNPIETQVQMNIKEDIVICYGMMESLNPIVNANYLIYDPQSENNPSLITENGSTFNHLAIVMNVEEAKNFTKKENIDLIVKDLFEKTHQLEVLILKDGPFGAYLFHDDKYFHIDAYETENVFKIGSGDVFVAVFGYLWAKEKIEPTAAAQKASLATALYCNDQVLQIKRESLNNLGLFKKVGIDKTKFDKKIYLAGPFFTMADRWLIEEAKFQLEKFGANVFSPLHDVGYGKSDTVAKEDLKGVDESNILYAVLNDYDPGTIFEVGYAISKGIPVVIFIENKTPINMTMFEGSGCIIESDFATSIYKVIWEVTRTK
ncbi:nucleoside 2-deoxyribosyltransferase [Arcobacter sp. CECT 8986]|uniref:PfkB family carbohydrate kinase n=1 Tax=Arcobacter sp. CECT 8986 TaxID=2044507 RepID=UPI0010098BB2|nr:PfkB family carbohydrate kinase [Arcobacter sp. CECT 8986]RXK01175.1 nucleoside 2-deoxyribosyltransferase [Arcobacter sp. CECT 8986]